MSSKGFLTKGSISKISSISRNQSGVVINSYKPWHQYWTHLQQAGWHHSLAQRPRNRHPLSERRRVRWRLASGGSRHLVSMWMMDGRFSPNRNGPQLYSIIVRDRARRCSALTGSNDQRNENCSQLKSSPIRLCRKIDQVYIFVEYIVCINF